MAIDGHYDGKITIQKGQGISQAIRDELGLTQAECNKLGSSIWTKIFEQVEAQNQQGKIYDGGNDLNGATNKNFVVNPNDEISFSKEIWNNIVQLVNDKLGKSIAKLDPNPPADDPNPPADDPNPPAKDPNPPADDPNFSDNPKCEYDANGNKIREIFYNSDGSICYYDKYEYDSNGNMTKDMGYGPGGDPGGYNVYEYDADGNMTREIVYSLGGYLDRYNKYEYDANDNMTKAICYADDGEVWMYAVYEYDADGNKIKETEYEPDGTVR